MRRWICKSGYAMVRRLDLTKHKKGMMLEHRAVWIDHYGSIPEGAVIHHKNGDKTDNRINNLELFDGNGTHIQKCHTDLSWLDPDHPKLKPFTEKEMVFIRDHLPIDRVLQAQASRV